MSNNAKSFYPNKQPFNIFTDKDGKQLEWKKGNPRKRAYQRIPVTQSPVTRSK